MDRYHRNPDRTLLILDLDETLIHACEQPLDRTADFEIYGYHVYRRPGLDEFLSHVLTHFDVAVWSSASDLYVQAVVDRIFPDPARLQFVWGRSRATLRRAYTDSGGYMIDAWDHMHYLKPLRKVRRIGWSLQRMLIVDDTPAKCARNYGNAIYPRPFEGDPADQELALLASYLTTLKDTADVRKIEKRNWRGQPSGE
ncbi:phosphoprotein phosphatase [Altererythrobacter xixiisoli]|uniref:Phosphoprotein phosphatase n=1 Tax=Croceibacterium xixiisoli TaxID=1476466 RepID=A0A6I4TWF5_9SPHN|nr:HAD family hydrolase [Croceibacterium xixiisoli]MXO99451.1 phosphoprotein phosphatase [Croceibacterium xixiisoli]